MVQWKRGLKIRTKKKPTVFILCMQFLTLLGPGWSNGKWSNTFHPNPITPTLTVPRIFEELEVSGSRLQYQKLSGTGETPVVRKNGFLRWLFLGNSKKLCWEIPSDEILSEIVLKKGCCEKWRLFTLDLKRISELLPQILANNTPKKHSKTNQTMYIWLIYIIYVYIGSTPHPATVTTMIVSFVVGNPYIWKPFFAAVTGWGAVLNMHRSIHLFFNKKHLHPPQQK